MSRRRRAEPRIVKPDPRYNNAELSKFINRVMLKGKKSTAQRVVYDALDLVQEVFLGVYRNLASYRGDGAFPAWLFRIAAYRCTDYLRRRRPVASLDDDEPAAEPCTGSDPVLAAIATDANRLVVRALAVLPPAQRHVVELKFFQHCTFDEIGARLGISPNTAKTRLYSALRKLKACKELNDEL